MTSRSETDVFHSLQEMAFEVARKLNSSTCWSCLVVCVCTKGMRTKSRRKIVLNTYRWLFRTLGYSRRDGLEIMREGSICPLGSDVE